MMELQVRLCKLARQVEKLSWMLDYLDCWLDDEVGPGEYIEYAEEAWLAKGR